MIVGRNRISSAALVGLLLIGPASAHAQAMPQVAPSPIACPATPAPLQGALSGWNRRVPLTAAANAKLAGSTARLTLGQTVDGGLLAAPGVRYAPAPAKPATSTSFGGIYSFSVTEAGQYRVALGAAAWIDVLGSTPGSKPLASVGHGHGPDCSGIRKMVDFALGPGEYLLQISGGPESRMPLLVTRLP